MLEWLELLVIRVTSWQVWTLGSWDGLKSDPSSHYGLAWEQALRLATEGACSQAIYSSAERAWKLHYDIDDKIVDCNVSKIIALCVMQFYLYLYICTLNQTPSRRSWTIGGYKSHFPGPRFDQMSVRSVKSTWQIVNFPAQHEKGQKRKQLHVFSGHNDFLASQWSKVDWVWPKQKGGTQAPMSLAYPFRPWERSIRLPII